MKKENSNTKVKDSSAKLIFEDSVLCAQFLRDYIDIPMLKNVQPEDIKDETERFVHIFAEERNSDVVKRIKIQQNDEIPFYFISLIEHKSKVDYNVIMQVFRYIAFIWEEYEKEMEKKSPGISKKEGFKYPPILPIIFYDGLDNWTAVTRLHDRVLFSDMLGEYIPDYHCIVMQLKNYTNAELLKKNNLLSLLLLIDKMKDMEDFAEFLEDVKSEDLKQVTENTPQYLLELTAKIMEVFLAKLNVPEKEAVAFTERIWVRGVGELFANFKGYDVQATRKEAREEGRQEALTQAIDATIHIMKKLNAEKETVIEQIVEEFDIGKEEVSQRVELIW